MFGRSKVTSNRHWSTTKLNKLNKKICCSADSFCSNLLSSRCCCCCCCCCLRVNRFQFDLNSNQRKTWHNSTPTMNLSTKHSDPIEQNDESIFRFVWRTDPATTEISNSNFSSESTDYLCAAMNDGRTASDESEAMTTNYSHPIDISTIKMTSWSCSRSSRQFEMNYSSETLLMLLDHTDKNGYEEIVLDVDLRCSS